MWDNLQVVNHPLLLKATTGSGKTEAVLAPFLSQFINNRFHIAPRLIYVLPMRVLVNSVAERRCARYEGESGEMIISPVEGKNRGHLPYEEKHLLKTWEWLQKNKKFNIRNFDEVCSFVDSTLDYQANDYEARYTLIDLYECVLYADEKPSNIQLRDGKPITLVVVDLSISEGRKKEDRIKDAIQKTNIRDNSISVDFGIGWKLLKDGNLKYRLNFDGEKGEWNSAEVGDISPFGYYLLEKDNYDQLKGVKPDVSSYII